MRAGNMGPRSGSALETLAYVYAHPRDTPRGRAHEGCKIVATVATGVPVELIEAAGCYTLTVRGEILEKTPLGDQFMEDDLGLETRWCFEQILAGVYDFVDLLVISRTSDNALQLYYYLKEVVRLGEGAQVPPLYLYDMLHLRSDPSYRYGLERTRELRRRLEVITGRVIEDEALRYTIEVSNVRRGLQRDLDAARRLGCVSGTEARQVIGAGGSLSTEDYLPLLRAYLEEVHQRIQTDPRRRVLLIASEPQVGLYLHETIEHAGLLIVGEDDVMGARAAGADIVVDADPLRRIFEKYYLDVPSPRIFPAAHRDGWLTAELEHGGVDGVVFFVPPGDLYFGWDYPRLEQLVRRYGLPSLLLLNEDPSRDSGRAAIDSAIREFAATLPMPTAEAAV